MAVSSLLQVFVATALVHLLCQNIVHLFANFTLCILLLIVVRFVLCRVAQRPNTMDLVGQIPLRFE